MSCRCHLTPKTSKTKELLEKLKEQCPDVQIPEWLNGSTAETPTSQQSENILPDP